MVTWLPLTEVALSPLVYYVSETSKSTTNVNTFFKQYLHFALFGNEHAHALYSRDVTEHYELLSPALVIAVNNSSFIQIVFKMHISFFTIIQLKITALYTVCYIMG